MSLCDFLEQILVTYSLTTNFLLLFLASASYEAATRELKRIYGKEEVTLPS